MDVDYDRECAVTKPYKVICISIYESDLVDVDAKVAELKRRGATKMNRSWLIRLALSRLSVDAVQPAAGELLECRPQFSP